MGLNTQQRIFFHSLWTEYVENQIPARQQDLIKMGIFEKERNLKHDQQTKLKLINIYNEELDNLPNIEQEFDLGLICDMILDAFRYKQREIIKVD